MISPWITVDVDFDRDRVVERLLWFGPYRVRNKEFIERETLMERLL